MANSYIAVPNVLPGNVTIGGNLTVSGNYLTIGSFTEKMRLGVDNANSGKLSWNQQAGGAVRDNAAKPAQSYFLGNSAGLPEWELQNSAGSLTDAAQPATIFTNTTQQTNTGNTTENTIYTKTIRANLIGANGALRIYIGIDATTQGGTPSIIRAKLGGTNLCTWGPDPTDNTGSIDCIGYICNVNSASVQKARSYKLGVSLTRTTVTATGAVNTAVDQTFTITAQCGAASDQQDFRIVVVELVNTFGPVT